MTTKHGEMLLMWAFCLGGGALFQSQFAKLHTAPWASCHEMHWERRPAEVHCEPYPVDLDTQASSMDNEQSQRSGYSRTEPADKLGHRRQVKRSLC